MAGAIPKSAYVVSDFSRLDNHSLPRLYVSAIKASSCAQRRVSDQYRQERISEMRLTNRISPLLARVARAVQSKWSRGSPLILPVRDVFLVEAEEVTTRAKLDRSAIAN